MSQDFPASARCGDCGTLYEEHGDEPCFSPPHAPARSVRVVENCAACGARDIDVAFHSCTASQS